MRDLGVEEGYMALCVSIMREVSPDKAFCLLGNKRFDENVPKRKCKRWDSTERTLMRIMRNSGMTWDEVGYRFGVSGKHARSIATYGG